MEPLIRRAARLILLLGVAAFTVACSPQAGREGGTPVATATLGRPAFIFFFTDA